MEETRLPEFNWKFKILALSFTAIRPNACLAERPIDRLINSRRDEMARILRLAALNQSIVRAAPLFVSVLLQLLSVPSGTEVAFDQGWHHQRRSRRDVGRHRHRRPRRQCHTDAVSKYTCHAHEGAIALLRARATLQLHTCAVAQLHNCTTAQQRNCTNANLRNYTTTMTTSTLPASFQVSPGSAWGRFSCRFEFPDYPKQSLALWF